MNKVDIPAGNLMEKAVLVRHWQSDVAFFHDEVCFLNLLLDSYLKWLVIDESIVRTRVIAGQLGKIGKKLKSLTYRLESHFSAISRTVEQNSGEEPRLVLEEHGQLEDAMAAYVKDFRTVKKEVFSLTERVMDSERNPLLLDR